MNIYIRFITKFFVFFILLALPLLSNFFILRNTKEFLSLNEVIQLQKKHNNKILFNSATSESFYRYKLLLYQEKKPDVICLGSSRVMQFRDSFFSKQFTNLGGMVKNFDDLGNAINDLVEIKKPELILIGIDFWWFHSNYKKSTFYESDKHLENPPLFSTLTQPYKWIISKQITFYDYFNYLKKIPNNNIGIQAVKYNNGFAFDGSLYEHSIISGLKQIKDQKFSDTTNRIKTGTHYYEWGDDFSEYAFLKLNDIENYLNSLGIKHIYFMTPVAPKISDLFHLNNEKYLYITKAIQKMNSMNLPFINYLNLKEINTSNCEFLDGSHGGDLLYARLLLDINSKYKLDTFLNKIYLESVTKKYQNIAMIPMNEAQFFNEVDFLKIGCNKKQTGDFTSAI